jgi:hypothetical protein
VRGRGRWDDGEGRREWVRCGAGWLSLCFAWISLFVSSRWREEKERGSVDFSIWLKKNQKTKLHERGQRRRDDELMMRERLQLQVFGVWFGRLDLVR